MPFELLLEGGIFSYVVLVVVGLASLAGVGLLIVCARRPSWSPAIVLWPLSLPLLAAFLGTKTGVDGIRSVVGSAPPSVQGRIFITALGELSSLSILATFGMVAGLCALAVGLWAGAVMGKRLSWGVTALALTSSAVAAVALLNQNRVFRDGFVAIGHAENPVERMPILLDTIRDWQKWHLLADAGFAVAGALAVMGMLLLGARGKRATALKVGGGLLLGIGAVWGSERLVQTQLFALPAGPTAPPVDLVTVNGVSPNNELFFTLEDVEEHEEIDFVVRREARRLDGDRRWLSLGVGPKLKPDTVLRVLQVAHAERVDVELIGNGPVAPIDVPPRFEPAVSALRYVTLAAPVRILFVGEVCEGCGTGFEMGAGVAVDELIRRALGALSEGDVLLVRVPLLVPSP